MLEELGLLGKYEIIEEIGRGGFAIVYRARDTILDRVVALKVLHPYWTNDPSFVARFQQEARSVARLRHSHIVTVYETGEVEGQLYIAMEYVPGRTLRELLEDEGALLLERALPILEGIAEALDYAHGQGMIHRDVKPGNVMVERTARGPQAMLADFGLVKAMSGSAVLTSQGTLLGSPEYMAPEQADPARAGEVGPAADRYALGILAYQMLTGRVPFAGNTPGTLYAHVHEPVPEPRALRPELPQGVMAALIKMLAKAPEDRFESACAFVERLQEAEAIKRQKREQEAQLAPLYESLQAAAEREDWGEVLALGGQIRAVDPAYRDVARLMARARRQLDRPRPESRPSERSDTLPGWVWGFGGAGLVAMLLLGGWALGLFSAGEPPETPTVTTNVLRSTQTLMPQPVTDTSEPVVVMTASPTSSPTDTPARSARTATATSSPAPTNMLRGASLILGSVCDDVGCNGDRQTRSIDGMGMVYVPDGTFQMGSTEGDSDERPVHAVTLDGFWIDRTEITNEQFAAFLSKMGNKSEGRVTWLDRHDDCPIEWAGDMYQAKNGFAQYPVIGVSWYGAAAYCKWAGGRLPTEAEWEYAARGPEGLFFPWGDTFDGTRLNSCDVNCIYDWKAMDYDDGYEKTAPVGSFKGGASWCGALDLAGNVWEWVQDWYDAYPMDPETNPTGPETGDYRVLRGGSWSGDVYNTRSAGRNGYAAVDRIESLGFRCVVGSTSSSSD